MGQGFGDDMDPKLAPRVSCIVACYEALYRLPCMLWSLKAQSLKEFEVLVTDNSTDPSAISYNYNTVMRLQDPRFQYMNVQRSNCYQSARVGAEIARGRYLCFPNDDEYYVPGFLEIMLREAEREPAADLVYCDCVFDPRWSRGYCRPNRDQQCKLQEGTWVHYAVQPTVGTISKGGFLITREMFLRIGFPGDTAGIGSDGFLVYEAERAGAVMRKAPGVLWVHN